MRRILYLALALAAAGAARADLLPTPDHGPPVGDAGGLTFSVEWVAIKMPPGYTKNEQVVRLTGCTEGRDNCTLAHAKNLIGMEVQEVDGHGLSPERGMVKEIQDAFARKDGGPRVTLTLYGREQDSPALEVSFKREP